MNKINSVYTRFGIIIMKTVDKKIKKNIKENNFSCYNKSNCYCLDMRKTSQKITNIYTEALKPINISVTQFSLIKNIQKLQPVNVTDLANEMKLDRTTVVRTLKILENRGLILDISGNGSRNRKLILTENGKSIADEGNKLWIRVQHKFEDFLGKKDLKELLRITSKLENIA
ncbi:Transcriptional regulator SlyA [Candidatus Methanobinarius endosymbioticus]|uniref:Transcriptional regulator SlyA n=1 Tax=Candidatus Methanobinarius endosymbioticus TaxID=2006182 RepID=A0A366MD53_9EURY|nr:Transcriptional regulator SlyA [Candidatus Methanobinarius endosymbioticus]